MSALTAFVVIPSARSDRRACPAARRGAPFVWMAPLAAGYVLTVFSRNVNGPLAADLTSDLGLGPDALGLLTAVYFATFAVAQLPVGILLDRFGPRQVQPLMLSAAALGAGLCAGSTGFDGILAGRALIGLGTSGSLMAGLKASAEWFPRERLALLNGGLVMVGGLGALLAAWPVEVAQSTIGWRGLFAVLALVLLAVAVAVRAVVPARGPRSTENRTRLVDIARDPLFRRLAPLSAACAGTIFALQGLWAGPFLAEVHGLGRADIASDLSLMAAALLVAAPLWGLVITKLRPIVAPFRLAGFAVLLLVGIEGAVATAPGPAWLGWTAFAMFGGITVLSFSILAEHFPSAVIGRANALLNALHITTAFLIQFGYGGVVGLWQPGAGRYPAAAYQWAIGLPVAVQLATLAWYLWAPVATRRRLARRDRKLPG